MAPNIDTYATMFEIRRYILMRISVLVGHHKFNVDLVIKQAHWHSVWLKRPLLSGHSAGDDGG